MEYSLNTLSKVTRCRSVHTVQKYLRYLEEAFLFFSLKRFSFKVRQQINANRKAYCVDNGLAIAAGFRFSPDRGKLYENLAAIVLHQRELRGQAQIFYWKSVQQEEVDFVVREGRRVSQLIQVCWRMPDERTKQREIRALLKGSRELKCNDLLVLTEDTDSVEGVEWFGMKGQIRFLPMSRWLLAETNAV